MMQYTITSGTQGICPTGWHIPTDNEYTIFTNYLGGFTVAGGKLKEAGYTYWSPPNTGATNSSGFTSLPAGARDWYNGTIDGLTYGNNLWSSEIGGSGKPWTCFLTYDYGDITRYDGYQQQYGFSIRCLKN